MKQRHLSIFFSCLILFFLTLTGCEKAQPFVDKVTTALNRESPEPENKPIKAIPVDPADIPPPPKPVKMEPVINKEARVSILGYHDFSEGRSTNDMILNIDHFRDQMQAIKDAELPVISMQQFLDWKKGKKDIPAECMMITIDDGWKATHTLAMDVLKEFGYPFTVFLYKKYIGVGGRSMTHNEIRELAASGATISSHSVSHKDMRGGSDEWLRVELEESMDFLEETFGDTGAVLRTFAYPYGYYNDKVIEKAKKARYEACFTVNGKKTNWDTPDMEIGRYVVHGTTLANFEPALNFGSGNVTSSGRKLITESKSKDGKKEAPLVTLYPPMDSVIKTRLPKIEVDLSRLEGVQPDSISLRVAGLGRVPHTFEPTSKRVTYQIPQRLRLDSCGVQLSFRHAGNKDTESIAWNFKIDRVAEYISSEDENSEERKRVSMAE